MNAIIYVTLWYVKVLGKKVFQGLNNKKLLGPWYTPRVREGKTL